jgi:hypothetical protein
VPIGRVPTSPARSRVGRVGIPEAQAPAPFRLLKKTPNFVLGSPKSSTYPRGYASGFDSPAAALDGLFEQPTVLRFVGNLS